MTPQSAAPTRIIASTVLVISLHALGCSKHKEHEQGTERSKDGEEVSRFTPTEIKPKAMEYDAMRVMLDDDTVGLTAKIEAMDRFLAENPNHRRAEVLRGLRKKYERRMEYEARRAAAQTEDAEAAPARAKLMAQMRTGSSAELLGPLLFLSSAPGVSAPDKDAPAGFEAVTLELETWGERVVKSPLVLGPNGTRRLLARLMRAHASDDVDTTCTLDQACLARHVNALVKQHAGGMDLYERDGRMSPAALQALLEGWSFEPTDRIGPVTARVWYTIYRPTIEEYAWAWRALEKVGIKSALSAYQSAYASGPEHMRAFYATYTKDNGLANRVMGPGGVWSPAVPVGFWMRRLADGTAEPLIEHLMAHIQRFDPDLHKKISAS
ncbi:MAG: hypothetical protein AAGI01_15690 [Myxococcota bacterium]